MPDHDSDRAAIVELIHRNRIAIWTNDFDLWDDCVVHEPYLTRWGWWRSGGIVARRGWRDLSARLRNDHPPPDPVNAFDTRLDNLQLEIRGDVAWATFVQLYDAYTIPDHIGPGVTHELRVFERRGGVWKIALIGVLDGNGGQEGTTMLRLEATGHILWASLAAQDALPADDDLVVRNGTLRFRDRGADRKLREALAWASSLDSGYNAARGARPIVVGAGEGLPTKIYWVVSEDGMILFTLAAQQLDAGRLALAAAVYDLSPAQQRLATLVVEGLALTEIAERMGVTQNTARTHLKRIFDKVGVRSQSALVRVLLTAIAPL
jgi:DNA-binding CsgD family transcriptional regulator